MPDILGRSEFLTTFVAGYDSRHEQNENRQYKQNDR